MTHIGMAYIGMALLVDLLDRMAHIVIMAYTVIMASTVIVAYIVIMAV